MPLRGLWDPPSYARGPLQISVAAVDTSVACELDSVPLGNSLGASGKQSPMGKRAFVEIQVPKGEVSEHRWSKKIDIYTSLKLTKVD